MSASSCGSSVPLPAQAATPSSSRIIPSDVIRLDILLTTGQRAFYDFQAHECAGDVKRKVWNHWPANWPHRPADISALRLVHLGSFLADAAPLGDGAASSSSLEPVSSGKQKATSSASGSGSGGNKKSSSSSSGTAANAEKSGKVKARENSSLAANVGSTAPRQFPMGQKTVLHLLVQGGFTDPSKSGAAPEVGQNEKGEEDEKELPATAAVTPTRRNDATADGEHGSTSGCCCVIC